MSDERIQKIPHNVIMQNRKTITITGVSDVDSFDETTVIAYTNMGELTIKGNGLHISKLNIETGELNVTGSFRGMAYTDEREKSGGILSRLFK